MPEPPLLLFAASSETLLELARDRWDALPGITAVLHTWNRQMAFHPHLHCIVTGGGLSGDDQRWVSCKNRKFLFPVRVLSDLLPGKFMDGLLRAHDRGLLRFVGTSAHLADPDAFAALRRALYDRRWVVYAKRAFGGPEQSSLPGLPSPWSVKSGQGRGQVGQAPPEWSRGIAGFSEHGQEGSTARQVG